MKRLTHCIHRVETYHNAPANYGVLFLAVAFFIFGCGGSESSSMTPAEPDTIETIEEQLHAALDAVNIDADFTFIVESNNGTQFIHSRGQSTETTSYRSASTSKLVAATVILWLVDQGILALDDHPQDYLYFWPTTGNHAAIELRHLLSFSSGLNNEPACLNFANSDFVRCVETIFNSNPTISIPGDEFYYASTHLQVAGLMAIHASGLSDWQQVFDYFKSQTQLFHNAYFDLPSVSNPRLAGGMHWEAVEYLEFLGAIFHQQLLSPALIEVMTSDQIGHASIRYSPVNAWSFGVDWHYGFGMWIECPSVPFNCPTTTRVSSIGAYGAYPFIDFEQHYFGIVAREGALSSGQAGYQLWAEVEGDLAQWATNNL